MSGLLIVGLHVAAYTKISPIDELGHIDVLVKSSHFERVQIGDRIGETAMREEACRRLDRDDPIPPCDTPELSPDYFQDLGYVTAASKFPVYHFVTGLPARALTAVLPGVSSIVTTARLLGGLWLAAGLFFTWLVMRELGVKVKSAVPALAILATTPVVLHASSIVNADATLLVGGASLLWSVLLWERRRLPIWAVAGIAVLALATELTNLLGLALVGGYLGVRFGQRHFANADPMDQGGTLEVADPDRGRRAGAAILLAAVALGIGAPAAGWAFPRIHRAVIGEAPPPVGAPAPTTEVLALQHAQSEVSNGPVKPEQIVGELGGLVTPVHRPYVPEFLAGSPTTVLITVTDWLLLGAAIGSAFRSRSRGRVEALAVATLVVMILGGPAIAMDNARRQVFFAIPPRFGLPLLPALTVLLSTSLSKRWTVRAGWAWAAFSVGWVVSRFLLA